ncbi:MAG TPA: replication factor A [Candidatus Thermoplasmatota archaeon]|nr:replication factor A [Candidatus Thermoplasmatota archaeon]
MQQTDLAPHVQEITRALDNRVESAEVEDELRRYLEYGVPLAQAKRDIVRNHGGTLKAGAKRLADLAEGDRGVDLLAKVLTVNPKEITVKGEAKTIFYGFLADETSKVPYTAWKDLGLERGAVYDIKNVYVKKGFREGVEVNLGDYTTVARSAVDLAVKDGYAAGPERVAPDRHVGELRDGMNNVTVTVRFLEAREKILVGAQGERKVIEGIVADATGKVPFTAWSPEPIRAGAVAKIRNAYVKSWRGVPNLNFGESATLEFLDDAALAPADALARDRRLTIGEVERAGGAQGVVLEGVVLEVKKGSGLIQRCTQCNRVLQKRECRVHGKVDGAWDLRVKAVLDDGWGAVTFFLGREGTEKLSGRTLAEWQKVASEAMTTDVVLDELVQRLTGRRLVVSGNALSDDFGLSLIATAGAFAETGDVKADAERLLGEVLEVLS